MCGIAGFQGSFHRAFLANATAILAHRGPDDCGEYYDETSNVGLAHTRLSILDTSPAGHQPMTDPETGLAIIFNGEIYNFRELRRELESRGHPFRSESDTEVLLRMHVQFGAEMLSRLNGIFALAVWNPLDQSLLLARDGLGVKPLYYAETSKGVIFASELKALLFEPSVTRTVDPNALLAHLRYLWCPAPRTILSSVRKLTPGQALVARAGKVVASWQHYRLPSGRDTIKISAGDAASELRRLLDQAVRRQLVSDVPIGAFLSGGMDSSAIVTYAAMHASEKPFPCFTIAFDGGSYAAEGFGDDLPFARQVARRLGARLHVVTVGDELADDIERMVYHLDEPQADLAPLNVLRIAELARDNGIKVLLSGAGGDDILSGYRRHQAVMLERYWAWLPARARRAVRHAAEAVPSKHPWQRRLSKAFRHADRDANGRIAGYFEWLGDGQDLNILSPQLSETIRTTPQPTSLERSLSELPSDTHPLARTLYIDTKHFLADHNLNYTDKMAMAAGVEVRVPFLDNDVVAFAASLPADLKLRRGVTKWIFRQAMTGLLPDNVISRSKSGFGVPLRGWLHGPMRELVEDLLSKDAIQRTGLFSHSAVARLLSEDKAGQVDGAYPILALLCIQLWCQTFLAPDFPLVRRSYPVTCRGARSNCP